MEALALPTSDPLPAVIRYRLTADPAVLYISAPEVRTEAGRAAVAAYAEHWELLRVDRLRLHSPAGVVARLSRAGRLTARLSRAAGGGDILALGATVLRCERDNEWYERAGYTGTETHHHVVLPEFEVTEALGR